MKRRSYIALGLQQDDWSNEIRTPGKKRAEQGNEDVSL